MKFNKKAGVPIGTIAIIIIVLVATFGMYWYFTKGDDAPDCSDVTLDYSSVSTGQTWFDPLHERYIRNWLEPRDWQYETPGHTYTYSRGQATNKEVFISFRDRVLYYKPVSQGFTSEDLDWFHCACKVIVKEL